jgi:hypothetical protein
MVPPTGSNKGSIAVDSNLLLLLVIGAWNLRSIATHKRLSRFNVEDFYLVRDFLASFRSVVTTPYVLAEVSNLAGVATGHSREAIYTQFARVIVTLDERHIDSASTSVRSEFPIFGLTDAALCVVCSTMPLLTEDGRLAAYMLRKGMTAWTIDNLKSFRNQANDAG